MAATEGIRSSFSTQLIPRSPKLRIYEWKTCVPRRTLK